MIVDGLSKLHPGAPIKLGARPRRLREPLRQRLRQRSGSAAAAPKS